MSSTSPCRRTLLVVNNCWRVFIIPRPLSELIAWHRDVVAEDVVQIPNAPMPIGIAAGQKVGQTGASLLAKAHKRRMTRDSGGAVLNILPMSHNFGKNVGAEKNYSASLLRKKTSSLALLKMKQNNVGNAPNSMRLSLKRERRISILSSKRTRCYSVFATQKRSP